MSESLEWKYVPPSYEIADSLMKLAQDIEIGKGRVSVATPPFLREAADRIQRQQDAIERLREALRGMVRDLESHNAASACCFLAWQSARQAKEALGDHQSQTTDD